ncbi:hypothetical protein RYH73_04565 [Olivibacter sp. CPCC 100613]|uniref:hypothetical protein n=1 Tax=Olivibacter sp. CPCC 100613 TaxID=3079931 RepID=UPI002FF56948
MKWLVRFFLSLCLLFLSKYNHLHAYADQDHIRYSLVSVFERVAYEHMNAAENILSFKPAPVNTEKVTEKIRATDKEEEDDSVSSRKYLEISNYFTDFFYALSLGSFWRQIRQSLTFCAYFPHFSSRTYLLFRVIRI